MPIYNFRAEATTYGTVSIEAETQTEAQTIVKRLQSADRMAFNIEMGAGETIIKGRGMEDSMPDDGTHYVQTPRENAAENAEALEELIEEEGADDNNVCPSAPRPLQEGETAHKWSDTEEANDEGVLVIKCDECGAEYDPEIHTK